MFWQSVLLIDLGPIYYRSKVMTSDCNSGISEFMNFRSFLNTEIQEFLQQEFRNFGNEIMGCKNIFHKNYHLLGHKTRWSILSVCWKDSSWLAMQSVMLSLIWNYSRLLFLHIHNIMQALQEVKLTVTVEVLCLRDSNLLTADIALRFKLKKLRAGKLQHQKSNSRTICWRGNGLSNP